MKKSLSVLVLSLFGAPSAFAQGVTGKLRVNLGSNISFWGLVGNVLSFMAASALWIAPTVFLVGVLMYTIGGVNSGIADTGKRIMISAVVGFAVIIGSYSILRVVYYFLQG